MQSQRLADFIFRHFSGGGEMSIALARSSIFDLVMYSNSRRVGLGDCLRQQYQVGF